MFCLKCMAKITSVFLLFAISFFTLCGFTLSGDVSVKHDGKAEAVFQVKSTLEKDEFTRLMQEKIDGMNVVSGTSDMITVRSVTSTDEGFSVNIKLRRLDKIKAQGEFDLAKFSDYTADGSMSVRLLESMYKANLSCTIPASYNGYLGQIELLKERTKNIKPYDAGGRELTMKEFTAAGKNDKKSTLLMFRVADVSSLESVRVVLPGKIKYYGNDMIEIIDENTICISPFNVKAQILKNSVVTEDGVEKIQSVVTNETVGVIAGYVVYEKSASPFAIGLYATIGCVVAGLLIACYIALYRRGKAEMRKNLRSGDCNE